MTRRSNLSGHALVAVIALVLSVGACSDAKVSSASESSAAPATNPTTSTTIVLSSDPVAGLPGEPPAAPAEPHGLVQVPSFPNSVRYEGAQDVRNQQLVTLTAGRVIEGEPFFAPTILEGSPNQRVVLRISNATPASHNFTVDAEHIDASIPDGATVDITVQFPTSGALVFYCKIHSKDEHGGALYTIA